ncbi:FG-GAP repeat domain-containing protein [Streptomyces sp. NPDC088090]|uniref:FG-GAP repeat domain-containing protein n=1 Tax=Streptomyces sp. NPDC088090 TaxID=3365822 RepID=UPI00384DFFC7
MHITRPRARRLAAVAVTVVLAATGGTLTTLPAAAAPVAAQDQQESAVPFPRDADVVGAGPGGFLSKTRGETPEFRWTRYADGSSVVLSGADAAGGGSDVVVTGDRRLMSVSSLLKVYDMTKPDPAPVVVDLDALGGYTYAGQAGDTLLVERYEDGHTIQYATGLAVLLAGGTPEFRKVEGGARIDCENGDGAWTGAGGALYDCWVAGERIPTKIFADLATGETRWHPVGPDAWAWDGAVSATHVAWREARVPGGHGVVVHRRGGSTREIWLPSEYDASDPVYLVGGWVASGRKAHIDGAGPAEGGQAVTRRPFVVQSAERPGESAVLLTAFSSAVVGPGGSLLVRGGTPEHGEGLYRISPRADDGVPQVELVASTGQSTVVTLTGHTTPNEITGERAARGVDFGWDLSRGDARVELTLTHVSSGKGVSHAWPAEGAAGEPRRITWHWDGRDLENAAWASPARSGTYEWKLTARPDDGIGPNLVTTGRFSVTRPAAAHDYDDDGTADLLARDPQGVLWRYGTRPAAPGGSPTATGASRVGGGWQAYDRLVSVGNVAGSSAPDSVARDRSGVLWLYQGTGNRNAPLSARTQIGGGWQTYDRITGGGDVTGDRRPDLLALDKTGVLWLHAGTGNAKAPFSARKRIGGGWQVYNEITAAGNLGGAASGDLLARDRTGVLWLYLGKGDGTFAARKQVGGGWGAFKGLTAVGDADGDGRADLVAWNGDETFYAGTGDWAAPFRRGVRTNLTQDAAYDSAF